MEYTTTRRRLSIKRKRVRISSEYALSILRRCFSGRCAQPQWEEMRLDLQRVKQYLAQGRWFCDNNHGCVRLGTHNYYLDYYDDK